MSSAGYWYATVVNLRSNAVDSHVAIGTNPSGRGVAISPDGARVYVSNGAVIDTATLKMVASFQGTSLNGLAVSPDGKRLYLPVIGYPSNGSVLVIDTTTYGVVASVSVGGNAMAFGQFIGPALVTPPAATPDLNQHGLTGSWYEPATSGQGVELEVYPDLSAPGIGLAFLSWFTYDSVAGGADRQRWYTAEGPVVTGQPNATLTIYQNIGGNFNAPPITAADQVGTARLSFDSCTTGVLSYNFY